MPNIIIIGQDMGQGLICVFSWSLYTSLTRDNIGFVYIISGLTDSTVQL